MKIMNCMLLFGFAIALSSHLSSHAKASELFINSADNKAWVVGRHFSDVKPGGAITNEDFVCTVLRIEEDTEPPNPDPGATKVKARMWVYSGVYIDSVTQKMFYTNKAELTAGGVLKGVIPPSATVGQGKLMRQKLVLNGHVVLNEEDGLQPIKVWITARKRRGGSNEPFLLCGYLISNVPIAEIETDTDCTEPPTEDVLEEEVYAPVEEEPITEPEYVP